jgi:hypothetical protein
MSVATRPRIPAITSEYRMASVKASAAECLAARIPLAFDVLLPGLDLRQQRAFAHVLECLVKADRVSSAIVSTQPSCASWVPEVRSGRDVWCMAAWF